MKEKDYDEKQVNQIIEEVNLQNQQNMKENEINLQKQRQANAILNNNLNKVFARAENDQAVDEELNNLQNQINIENPDANQNIQNNPVNNQNDIDQQINQLNEEIDRENADLLNQAIKNQQGPQNNNQNPKAIRPQDLDNAMNQAADNIQRSVNEGINKLNEQLRQRQQEQARQRQQEQERQRQQELQRQRQEVERLRRENQRKVREMRAQQERERERRAAERRQQESNAEFARNIYKTGRDNIVNRMNEGYGPVMKYYSPDDDYHIPEGLSREVVTAAVIGAAMDKSWLLDNASEQIAAAGSIENLQKKLIVDVMQDGPLDPTLFPIITSAFKRADAAVKSYERGDDSELKTYLEQYTNYSVLTVPQAQAADGIISSGYTPEQLSYKFCKEFAIDGPLHIEPDRNRFTEINKIKLTSYTKQLDSMKAAEQSKKRLINEVGRLTREQKEEIVADMLLDSYIANMATVQKKKLEDEVHRCRENAFLNMGLNEDTPDWNEYVNSTNGPYSDKAKDFSEAISKNTVSDFDVLLSTPNGRNWLKDQCIDKIKASEVYQNIVNSENPKTMIDNLMIADHLAEKGINALPDFKFSADIVEHTKGINDRNKPNLEAQITDINTDLFNIAFGNANAYHPITQNHMCMMDLSHKTMVSTASEINKMYQTIKKNDTLNGSKNYGDMKTALKELRDYTRELAKDPRPIGIKESHKYKIMVDKVNKLADHYLMNKEDINKPSSLEKVKGVREMKRRLLTSIKDINEAQKSTGVKISKELFGDRFMLLDMYSPSKSGFNPFYGDKYNKPESRIIHSGKCSGFTTDRTAGTSIAVMAMAASGRFSLEQLMDPTEAVEEKKAYYDEVIKTLKGGDDPANREKIARWIHDGRRVTDEMLDQKVKIINFKNADIYSDKNFVFALNMYNVRFDVEQEMFRVKDEYIKVAQESDPNFRDMNDAKVIWSPMLEIAQSMTKLRENAYEAATSRDNNSASIAASNLMANTEIIKKNLEFMDKKQEACKSIPVNEWFSDAEHAECGFISGTLSKSINDKADFENNPKLITSLLPKMVDGSLMKDTKYEPDYAKSKIKITSGFPSEESLRIEAENIEFLKKTDEAIKRLEDGQADYKNKKDFVTDSAYAIFGQMYRTAGMHTPIDAATGKKISLEEFMQKQLKSGVFEKSLKSRKNPKKFTDPKNIAKMAKDKKQIQKIITSHTDRNKERRAHRAARKNNVEHQNAL
ncbi:MAG TPA: hypothetical protein DEO83_01545 [Lachnospiraceae bacterium]|nr:hypothetical protein [Lachnospiraceae bacterium]